MFSSGDKYSWEPLILWRRQFSKTMDSALLFPANEAFRCVFKGQVNLSLSATFPLRCFCSLSSLACLAPRFCQQDFLAVTTNTQQWTLAEIPQSS